MNQISPLASGGAMLTVASVEPTVAWVLAGCHGPMPDSTPAIVTIALLALAHWATNLIAQRLGKPDPQSPLKQAGPQE